MGMHLCQLGKGLCLCFGKCAATTNEMNVQLQQMKKKTTTNQKS